MPSAVRITTGQLAFDGGVNSSRVPTIASKENPYGLQVNQLAWLINATVRDGGISHRPGYQYLTTLPIVALFQDAYMYEAQGEFPYIVTQIGGRTFRTLVDVDPAVTDEITIPGNPNPPDIAQGWTVQGEEFLVIQDGQSLPLFWDGATMRRSRGLAQVLGVVSAGAVVPAVGGVVLVTLTAPFAGTSGQLIYINGKTFTTSNGVNFIDLYRNGAGTVYNTGDIVPPGTTVDAPGKPTMHTTAPFQVPLPGGTAQDVAVDSVPAGTAGSVLVDVNGDINSWQIPATGLPPAGVNQVYIVNLTGIPGDPIAIGDTLESEQELPAGTAMDYYMGRIWVANGREYIAGDIVGGPSGSPQYGFRDSILKMIDNAFTASGGAFIVPSNAGNIRALKHPANLDTALGEGQLLPMTRRNVYSTNVVPDRAAWALLSEPIQRVAQINFGTVSDRSVVTVNGDLYYQAVDGIRSLQQSIRYFNSGPGNVALSNEVQRAIALNDKSLLHVASGAEMDNRLLQSTIPYQTPVGIAHKGLLPLNFDVLSTLGEKHPPAWEGAWVGIPFLKLLKGDFGGRQRCFAIIWSDISQEIQIWELTENAQEDYGKETTPGGDRITWQIETPSFDWGNSFQLKELQNLEFWIDRLSGTVRFVLEYRPGSLPCWLPYHEWEECAARNECELPNPILPCDHPTQPYLPQYRAMMTMPKPPVGCNNNAVRPTNQDFSFQFRLTIKGTCRIRGIMVHALPMERAPFDGLRCGPAPLGST